MPAPLAPPAGPGTARRLARTLFAGLAFVLALALGLALFLPWDLIWPQALARAAAGAPNLALGWRSIDDASALGFTLRGLSLNATGRGWSEAESLTLRLGPTPLRLGGFTAHTNRGALHLDEASLELGFSPLAVLHLTAGEELTLTLIRQHTVVATGAADLAKLLPGSKLEGVVAVSADVAWPDWRHYPDRGSAEVSAKSLTLPNGRLVAGLSASALLEKNQLTLRELAMQLPVPLRGHGSASLDWTNLPASMFEFSGVAYPGFLDKEVKRQGRLYEILHQ